MVSQYYRRLQLKERNDPLERAVKLLLNSIYGKMAQRVNGRIGNLFSPIIAAFTTGYTRAQLYKFMIEHRLEKEIVAFATDSVACRRKIERLESKKLEEMKLDKQGDDVIFISNGFYKFNWSWKQRGVDYDKERKTEIEHLDTQIRDDGQLYIAVRTTCTTHLRTGIIYNRLESIGKIEEYEKKISLDSDKKRFWSGPLLYVKDCLLLDSAPININQFADVIVNRTAI